MEKALAMLKQGHKTFLGSFYTVARRFSHILKRGGGLKSFHSLKGGVKSLTLS